MPKARKPTADDLRVMALTDAHAKAKRGLDEKDWSMVKHAIHLFAEVGAVRWVTYYQGALRRAEIGSRHVP